MTLSVKTVYATGGGGGGKRFGTAGIATEGDSGSFNGSISAGGAVRSTLNSGAGGAPGAAGTAGTGAGSTAGAAGVAIDKNGNTVNYTENGTKRGATVA